MPFSSTRLFRALWLAIAAAVLASCAPLSHKVIALDVDGTADAGTVSMLNIDREHPLILSGLDGRLLGGVRFPTAFRTWSFALSPGKHVLWLSNVPYGSPLIPQRRRCYAMEVFLEAGSRYVLRENPADELALLLREGGGEPAAFGRLVEKPFVFERNCRWK